MKVEKPKLNEKGNNKKRKTGKDLDLLHRSDH